MHVKHGWDYSHAIGFESAHRARRAAGGGQRGRGGRTTARHRSRDEPESGPDPAHDRGPDPGAHRPHHDPDALCDRRPGAGARAAAPGPGRAGTEPRTRSGHAGTHLHTPLARFPGRPQRPRAARGRTRTGAGRATALRRGIQHRHPRTATRRGRSGGERQPSERTRHPRREGGRDPPRRRRAAGAPPHPRPNRHHRAVRRRRTRHRLATWKPQQRRRRRPRSARPHPPGGGGRAHGSGRAGVRARLRSPDQRPRSHHTHRGRRPRSGRAPLPLELPSAPVYLSWHQRYDTDHAHTWLRALARTALAACGAS